MAENNLTKLRNWIKTFPGFDILSAFRVDYTDQIPANGGVFPAGLVEISRKEDIVGNVTVTNQLNFGLYYVFTRAAGDDIGAQINADWIADFQLWVQEQDIRGLAPSYGRRQRIKAENGALYATDDEGAATYMVQLSIQYDIEFYEEV